MEEYIDEKEHVIYFVPAMPEEIKHWIKENNIDLTTESGQLALKLRFE